MPTPKNFFFVYGGLDYPIIYFLLHRDIAANHYPNKICLLSLNIYRLQFSSCPAVLQLKL